MTPLRRRGAARTRGLLLDAASALFAERGFDRTTVRDVGELAGVDPALIARYFGGKSGLYLAALYAELGHEAPADLLDPERLAGLLERVARRGPSPVFRAAVHPHDEPDVQAAARATLHDRIVTPMRERFERDGRGRAQLRAELAAAAFVGIVLSRDAGALEELAGAAPDDVLALTTQLLGGLLGPVIARPR